jgi:hypothetical protein
VPEPPEPSGPALPWLRGFPAAAFADEPSWRAEIRLHAWQAPDAECVTSAAGALQLTADVAPPAGAETVLASYTAGLVVLDARGRKIAAAPAFTCRGSVDGIEYIAAGDPLGGEPVIAVAAAAGGRAERTIWLFLFAVHGSGLAAIFAGPVEDWHGEAVATGEVALEPGGKLHHRAPNGAITLWVYDRDARRYVMREVLRGPSGTTGPAV